LEKLKSLKTTSFKGLWILRDKLMSIEKYIVIKIGGKAAEKLELVSELADDIKNLNIKQGYKCLLVHGGGKEVSAVTKKFGIEPVFNNGIRMTSKEEMQYVDMVLAGKVNKRLVRIFQAAGLNAVGLSGCDGKVFTGISMSPDNRTGDITAVDTKLLMLLLGSDYFPVISSVSMDIKGSSLNINADTAALSIAESIKAFALVFLSDIPGILKNGEVIPGLTPAEAEEEIKAGAISGGMIPKVQASVKALSNGINEIVIGEFNRSGSLRELMKGKKGTTIIKKS
jgi:acetylglutamate kinase